MLANLYPLLVAVALDPSAFLPHYPYKEQKYAVPRRTVSLLLTAAGMAAIGMIVYRFYKQKAIV
jgi:hypothetical protein